VGAKDERRRKELDEKVILSVIRKLKVGKDGRTERKPSGIFCVEGGHRKSGGPEEKSDDMHSPLLGIPTKKANVGSLGKGNRALGLRT